MNVIEKVLQFFAPHECLWCAREGYLLCPACAALLPSIQPRADFVDIHVSAVTPYQGLAKELVHRLKFERAGAAAIDMAYAMSRALVNTTYDGIVYVPTASPRVRQRGYDQAKLLAKGVSANTHIPLLSLLSRASNQRQVGAGRTERLTQMQHAFRVKNGYVASQQKFLLIDDVLTTGSTIRAAAAALRAAGATQIDVLVFAVA